jgi:hypothetical protein
MRQAREFNSKKGWDTIGGKTHYFKSKAEVHCAIHLQVLKENGTLRDWEYEPETFYFEGIKRGTTNYKPDFKVYRPDTSHFWVEVKGYMDAKSKTKIKRFAKYFPSESLIVVLDKNFLAINVEIQNKKG